ncbi:hypothetical protein [Streptomyces sp. NPDC003077]|uniref:hypothetical protein n=1 Tax=Streptomyces sp. NPDC003077 TaxID=3154443 RepID=UPI0033BE04EC
MTTRRAVATWGPTVEAVAYLPTDATRKVPTEAPGTSPRKPPGRCHESHRQPPTDTLTARLRRSWQDTRPLFIGVAVEAHSAELRRIESDLHDGAQAQLVALPPPIGLARQQVRANPDAASSPPGADRPVMRYR